MQRTRVFQEFIKFIKNKNFKPHPKKIDTLNRYLLIVSGRMRSYPRVKRLIEVRLSFCLDWTPKPYPKQRLSSKRGTVPRISLSKIGKRSYYDPETRICKMFAPEDEIPSGWIRGLIKSTPNTNTPEVRHKLSNSMKLSRSRESEEKRLLRIERWRNSMLKSKENCNV